jgi:hypothetical protein
MKKSSLLKTKQTRDKQLKTEKLNKQLLIELEEKERLLQGVLAHNKFKGINVIKATSKNYSSSTAFAVWSDWHLEENVDPKKVNGLNSFNLGIAKDRVSNCAINTVKLLKRQSTGEKIDALYICLLGDFISGNIHEELLQNCSLPPIKASLFARDLLKSSIQYVFDNTDIPVRVICLVGNHPRITKKIFVSQEQENSLEYFMYNYLANDFEGLQRLKFEIATGYHHYLNIYDYVVRLHHGHSVSYGGGVGGLTIPLNKKIQIWNYTKRADYDVLGHFHQFLDGGSFIVNGSLIGYNAYAIRIGAKFEPPRQAFFLINSQHGKSIVAPIFL